MKRANLLALCLVGSLAVTTSVQAIEVKKPEVGGLKNVTSAVSNATSSLTPASVRGTIGELNVKLATADASVQDSFNSLVSALSSKEEATKIKNQIAAINNDKSLSASEKSAKVAAVMSDYGNVLKDTQAELSEQLKNASATKRAAVADSIVALSVASLQYVDISKDCMSVVQSISMNPTLAVSLATELASLKDTASILKNNVKSLKNVSTQAIAVAKVSGIEVKMPSNKASKTSKVSLPLGN